MDFVTKPFRKDETLTSWTLLQHICPHFWAWLLNTIAITPKSEDKYVAKVFNWSEVHLSEMTCYKIHILVYFSYKITSHFIFCKLYDTYIIDLRSLCISFIFFPNFSEVYFTFATNSDGGERHFKFWGVGEIWGFVMKFCNVPL